MITRENSEWVTADNVGRSLVMSFVLLCFGVTCQLQPGTGQGGNRYRYGMKWFRWTGMGIHGQTSRLATSDIRHTRSRLAPLCRLRSSAVSSLSPRTDLALNAPRTPWLSETGRGSCVVFESFSR